MRRLVIHLGLPKTATTTLQTHIFPQLPGYLGRFYEGDTYPSAALTKQLIQLYWWGFDEKQVFEIDGHPAWVPALEAWVEELVASDEDILLWSEEGLSVWRSPASNAAYWPPMDAPGALPRRGSHPIVDFLQQLRELLPQDIELKTILTLRNQSDWLVSLAAQMHVRNTGFVDRLIRDDDAFLNSYAMTKDLECLRGPENHLTLLFENGLEHNVEEILKFAGYPPAGFQNLTVPEARENVGKRDKGWKVEAPAGVEGFLLAFRGKFPFLDDNVFTNDKWRRALRPLFGYEIRRKVLSQGKWKSFTISLTRGQRTAIKSHCKASNVQLSAHLDVDLEALGY